MRGVIKGVLAEELGNSLRMQKGYENALNKLPKGCLSAKNIKGHKYYYLVQRKGNSIKYLYKGKVSKLALQKQVICSKCDGKGGKEGAVKSCSGCNGRGVRVVTRQMGPMIQQMQQTCPECQGEGEVVREKDKCKGCHAKKVITERKVIRIFCLACPYSF